MNITEVKINIVNSDSVKAFASITIEDAIVIKNLRIVENAGRLFVAFPTQKQNDGSYKDIVFVTRKALYNTIQTVVLNEYRAIVG